MIVDMSPGHRISPSKGGATWQVTITKSAIPKEKTLAGVCLSLLGASPLVPTDTPPPFSSRLSRCSHLDCRAAKPGAWRNGAPFHGWNLPPALTRLRRKLGSGDEADRRFVRVLAAVLTDGLEAVEAAIREALDAGAASDEVILNILARYREPATDRPLDVVVDLKLSHPPVADCARYDTVRGLDAAA